MASEEIYVTELLRKLVSAAPQKIGMPGVVDKDLQKLLSTLEMVAAVTSDAERKQMKDGSVRLWLKKLQNVAYDAEDLLDEMSYDYEAIRLSERSAKLEKIRGLFKFGFKKAKRVKVINQQLDEIVGHISMFQLKRRIDYLNIALFQSDELRDSRMTDSSVNYSKIVGREKDISRIIEMLLMTNPSSSSSENFSPREKNSVISIVGMGGLGKTTLAQMVYNDYSICRSFEQRLWVSVSDDFDIYETLRRILESLNRVAYYERSNILLASKIQEAIRGKKCLLVLDDLWNDNAEDWEKFMGYFSGGAPGCKILVTSRKENAASIARGALPPYNLKPLSQSECWSIIKNRAFSAGGASETPSMSIIGMEIARKCAGLPLVANSLGGLMHTKRAESDWSAIRDNGVLCTPERSNRVVQILKLSYDDLPSHLKKCFSYCCLFPKDWEFNRETLIQLWMAEGFLDQESRVHLKTSVMIISIVCCLAFSFKM